MPAGALGTIPGVKVAELRERVQVDDPGAVALVHGCVAPLRRAVRRYAAIFELAERGDAVHFLRVWGHGGEAALRDDALSMGAATTTIDTTTVESLVREQGNVHIADDTPWDGERGVLVSFTALAAGAWELIAYEHGRAREASAAALARGRDARVVAVEQSVSPAERLLFMRRAAFPRGAFGLDPSLSRQVEYARDRARRRFA